MKLSGCLLFLTPLLLASSFLPPPVHANRPLVLVRDQEAQSTVVLGDDRLLQRTSRLATMDRTNRTRSYPVPLLTVAAEYLAETLNEMAGIHDSNAEVKVVSTIEEASTPVRILLGGAAIEEYNLYEEAEAIPYMGFVYRTEGNDLLIYGSSVKGTANGIYSFLQDQLGVRWFGPGQLFTVVPERETIEINPVESMEAPDFTGRFSALGLYTHPVGEWKHHMRLAETIHFGAVPFYNHSHNFRQMFPPSEYEDRPELYALRGGRRHMGPGAFGLCYSNPDVVEIATEAAKEYFRGGDHRHSFSLGIHDGAAFCECEECAKLQPERTFRGARVASDMYFHFVNEVARRVGEEFPDRYLGLIAYNDVTAPPLGEVEPNVFAVIVSDVSEYYDPAFREMDMENVRAWQEKDIYLGMYYYTGLAKLVPGYFPRMLGEVLQDRKDRNFVAMYTEAHPGWPWTGPMHYVQARLWWDADLDVDELLTDYFETLYGPAAPYMQELFDLFEEIHTRPRTGGFLYEHYNFAQFRPYTGEDLARMRELIAGAHGAIEELSIGRGGRENLESQRLAYVTDGLRVFLEMLEGVVLARDLEELDLDQGFVRVDDVEVMEILWQIDRINQLLDNHIQTYREAIITDTTHSNRFLNDTATPVRNLWNRYLTEATGTTLAALYRNRNLFGSRAAAAMQERIEQFISDPAARALFMVETGQAELGPNLATVNPGFEEVDMDGVPLEWSLTSERDRDEGYVFDTVEHDQVTREFGRYSGRMRGITRRGYYLTAARGIEGGQPYLIEVDAKLLLPGDRRDLLSGEVYLRVEWSGRVDGSVQVIRGEHRYEQRLQEVNEWERLRVAAIAPEGANTARVFLRVENQRGEEEAWFDNLSVRMINMP